MSNAIRTEIMRQVQRRGYDKTICPSEVARAICEDESEWRDYMSPVRRVAQEMVENGELEILQRGEVATAPFSGPIRFRVK